MGLIVDGAQRASAMDDLIDMFDREATELLTEYDNAFAKVEDDNSDIHRMWAKAERKYNEDATAILIRALHVADTLTNDLYKDVKNVGRTDVEGFVAAMDKWYAADMTKRLLMLVLGVSDDD